MKYNLEALKSLSITRVVEWLGGEGVKLSGNTKQFRCFNKNAHKANDKHPSLAVREEKGTCKCFACDVEGDVIAIATHRYGSFKEACEALHYAFDVPFLDGTEKSSSYTPPPKKKVERPNRDYSFDVSKHYTYVELERYIGDYANMSDAQKLKILYTYVYRFSLNTNQSAKIEWYKEKRGIHSHSLLESIGWLSPGDIKVLKVELESKFPLEDLIKYKLYAPADAKFNPMDWRYMSDTGFCVVPFHELYTDMVNGLMLRNTSPKAGKYKEIQIACWEFVIPIPFALSRETLIAYDHIFITEGHVDGLSLGEKPFIASPGINGIADEILPLLQDKRVFIVFDMDEAGANGANALKQRLMTKGAKSVKILEWDKALGCDINEVLLNGNLKSGIFRDRRS